jgi:hypothetical protein
MSSPLSSLALEKKGWAESAFKCHQDSRSMASVITKHFRVMDWGLGSAAGILGLF